MSEFMPKWINLSIHTRKHTVLISTKQFVDNSKVLEKFSRNKYVFEDLIGIYCYQDGFVRLTYSSRDNLREAYLFYYPDFEHELDEDIERIKGI